MTVAHAMWIHGHSMQIEYPERVNRVQRKGFSVEVQSGGVAHNWFHFAIPTPVIVDGNRLTVGSVLIRFKSSGGAVVQAVHVYDGEIKIAARDQLTLNPTNWHVERVDVPSNPEIRWGLGISVQVGFGPDGGEIEFSAAGCDFKP
jgi:hypothetical protein